MAILETKSLEELIQIARKVEKVNILPNQPIRMESNAIGKSTMTLRRNYLLIKIVKIVCI